MTYVANLPASNGHPFAPHDPTDRLYHTVAVLLPDGRVFLAGGDDAHESNADLDPPTSEYSGELYSPPYLRYGHRPLIESVPAEISLSTPATPVTFSIQSANIVNATGPDKVVLLRPASVTHFFDTDQRYVECAFTKTNTAAGKWQLNVAAPTDDLAPNGWYMIFVVEFDGGLSTRRVPSVGEFVHLYH